MLEEKRGLVNRWWLRDGVSPDRQNESVSRCSRKLCERRRLDFYVCVGSGRLRVTPCNALFHFTSIVPRTTSIGLLPGATDLRGLLLWSSPGRQSLASP
jgi:hypothetical protein